MSDRYECKKLTKSCLPHYILIGLMKVKQKLFDHMNDEHLTGIFFQFAQHSDSVVQVKVKRGDGMSQNLEGSNDGEGFESNMNTVREREGKCPLSFRRTCRKAMSFHGQQLHRLVGHGIHRYIIMLEKCGHPELNVFHLK